MSKSFINEAISQFDTFESSVIGAVDTAIGGVAIRGAIVDSLHDSDIVNRVIDYGLILPIGVVTGVFGVAFGIRAGRNLIQRL